MLAAKCTVYLTCNIYYITFGIFAHDSE